MRGDRSLRYNHQLGVSGSFLERNRKRSNACKALLFEEFNQTSSGNSESLFNSVISVSGKPAWEENQSHRSVKGSWILVGSNLLFPHAKNNCGQCHLSFSRSNNCQAKRRSPNQLWKAAGKGSRSDKCSDLMRLGHKGIRYNCNVTPMQDKAWAVARPTDGKLSSSRSRSFAVRDNWIWNRSHQLSEAPSLLTRKGKSRFLSPATFLFETRIVTPLSKRVPDLLKMTYGQAPVLTGKSPGPFPNSSIRSKSMRGMSV